MKGREGGGIWGKEGDKEEYWALREGRGKGNAEAGVTEKGQEEAIRRSQVNGFICNVHSLDICSRVSFSPVSSVFAHTHHLRVISYFLALMFIS